MLILLTPRPRAPPPTLLFGVQTLDFTHEELITLLQDPESGQPYQELLKKLEYKRDGNLLAMGRAFSFDLTRLLPYLYECFAKQQLADKGEKMVQEKQVRGGSRQPLRGLSFSFLSTSLSFFVPGPPRTPFLSPSFLSRSLVLGPSRLRADTYSSVDSRPSPTPAREAAVHHQHRQRHP